MPRCDRCEDAIDPGEEWIQLRQKHPHMEFESCFCSSNCAVAYLEDGLVVE